jgi:hypothetical protein
VSESAGGGCKGGGAGRARAQAPANLKPRPGPAIPAVMVASSLPGQRRGSGYTDLRQAILSLASCAARCTGGGKGSESTSKSESPGTQAQAGRGDSAAAATAGSDRMLVRMGNANTFLKSFAVCTIPSVKFPRPT